MNAKKTRRVVGGYIWREKMRQVYQEHDVIRKLTDDALSALDNGGMPSVRVIVMYIAQIAVALNTANAALRELEIIAESQD